MDKNNSFKHILLSYIKQYFKLIILLLLFVFIFAFIFSLYQLEREAIFYSSILCLFIGAIILIINFYRFYKKHIKLYKLQNEIALSLENLPSPQNLIEEDYTNLIVEIDKSYKEFILKSDNTKSDMLDYYTMWVHQIKTPISAMKLLLQSEDTPLNAELSSELFKIEQYVEMVLSYIRLDSNENDFVIKEYNLDDIIKQAVRKYAPLFIRKKIVLNYKDVNCNILTDEKWLLFVIEQILSNAIKYTNKGKISIYMQADKELVIEDNGIGIYEEDIPRLFEKGFTGYNGRIDKKSTGLGLYLCRKITTMLSHDIRIESEIGVKTKVILNLAMIDLDTK